MASEWRKTTLGEIIRLKRGYDLPQRERVPGKVPIVSSSGISDFHSVAKVRGPGVVTGRYGTVGEVFYIPEDYWPLNTALYVEDFKGNDRRFISYFLKTINWSAYSDKAAVPGINRNHVHEAEVIFPPLPEQRRIAAILSAFDDKIELNRRMNATLEAMAGALFKSWFVDFDPVRAKQAGRPTGLPAEIDALFPDGFVDSELGEIPSGWVVGRLEEIIEIHDSKRIPLSNRERADRQGPYPYYGAASIMDYVDDYIFDGVYVLVGEDGSVVNNYGNPVVQYAWGKFWVNNHAHVLKGKDEFSTEHLLLFLKQTLILPYVTGAVQPKLNQGNLKIIPFVKPPQMVADAFSGQIDQLFAMLRKNSDDIKILQTFRDILLPRLMLGGQK